MVLMLVVIAATMNSGFSLTPSGESRGQAGILAKYLGVVAT